MARLEGDSDPDITSTETDEVFNEMWKIYNLERRFPDWLEDERYISTGALPPVRLQTGVLVGGLWPGGASVHMAQGNCPAVQLALEQIKELKEKIVFLTGRDAELDQTKENEKRKKKNTKGGGAGKRKQASEVCALAYLQTNVNGADVNLAIARKDSLPPVPPGAVRSYCRGLDTLSTFCKIRLQMTSPGWSCQCDSPKVQNLDISAILEDGVALFQWILTSEAGGNIADLLCHLEIQEITVDGQRLEREPIRLPLWKTIPVSETNSPSPYEMREADLEKRFKELKENIRKDVDNRILPIEKSVKLLMEADVNVQIRGREEGEPDIHLHQ